MEGWQEGEEHQLVVKIVKSLTIQENTDNETNYGTCSNELEQWVKKKHFMKTKDPKHYCKDHMGEVFWRTVDICIDGDTDYDADTDDSELELSDEEEHVKPLNDDSMSISEEENDMKNSFVIIDSFFT